MLLQLHLAWLSSQYYKQQTVSEPFCEIVVFKKWLHQLSLNRCRRSFSNSELHFAETTFTLGLCQFPYEGFTLYWIAMKKICLRRDAWRSLTFKHRGMIQPR